MSHSVVGVAFKGGPLDSSSLPNIPDDTRILYVTFNATDRDKIRWAAWTVSQPPGTIPALVVDPGESVYVYRLAQRTNPIVKIQDGNEVKDAMLFEFSTEGGSVQATLAEDNGEEAEEATQEEG